MIRQAKIAYFVNSFVSRPGNIGVRTGYILKYSVKHSVCVCRGAEIKLPHVQYLEMGWLGHLPRILNAVRIYLVPQFNHRIWDIALFEYFSYKQLCKIEKMGVQVAHVWDNCPKLICALKKIGIRVILDVPMAPNTYGERLYQQGIVDFLRVDQRMLQLEQAVFKVADHIIAPSHFVMDEMVRVGIQSEKISIVEFGVERCQGKQQGNARSKQGLDYCFVGNINLRKGIKELIEAWDCDEFKEDRLHLCGRINPDVREIINNIQGGGKIITPGFVNPCSYLIDCDIFVLPSWLEGSAKSVYEAMACGLPAIVTYSAGSIVRNGVDGFTIKAGDVNALRKYMIWLKDNSERREEMSVSARNNASMFTWRRYSERVLDILFLDANN